MRLLTLMQYVDTCWLYGSAFTKGLSLWKGLNKQTYRFLHFNLKFNKVKHLYLWWSCFEPLQRRTYLLEMETLVTHLPRLLTYSAKTEIIVWYTNKFKVKWNFSTNILHKCFHFHEWMGKSSQDQYFPHCCHQISNVLSQPRLFHISLFSSK